MNGYFALAGVYDELSKNINNSKKNRFIHRIFRRNNIDGIVLDAGCGTGALSLLLEKRGYDIIGVDSSAEMLSVAYEKAAKTQSKTVFLNQDLADLDLYGTVRGIVCMQDTLNHIGENLLKVIERFSLFLEPGGIVVFDINTPYKHQHVLAGNIFVYEFSGGICVWCNENDPEYSRIKLTVDIFFQDNGGTFRRETDTFYEYTIEPEDIESLFRQNGFEITEKLDGESYKKLKPDSERVLYVAKKIV